MQHPPGHLLHLSYHSISLTSLVMYCFKLRSVGYEIIWQPDMNAYCCFPLTRLVIYCTPTLCHLHYYYQSILSSFSYYGYDYCYHSVATPSLVSFINSAPVFSTGTNDSGTTAPLSAASPMPLQLPGVGPSPSLATLLPTPIASLGPCKTAPLVLSSALPPIPGKVVESIRTGSYVDLLELLPDNVALKQQIVDTGLLGPTAGHSLRLREISDVETWLYCFLAFVAAKVSCEETRQLMAYGQIILMLARKHVGRGWKAYDAHFRQLVGAGHLLPWTELNPSMMAADVLQVGGQTCSLCQAHDHRREECALATAVSSTERRPRPYKNIDEICRHFNWPAGCLASRCRLTHKCWSCGCVDHGAATCRPRQEGHKVRPAAGIHKDRP